MSKEQIMAAFILANAMIPALASLNEQPEPESEIEVSSSLVQSVPTVVDRLAYSVVKSIPTEDDYLEYVEENKQEKQEEEGFVEANNQVVASGSPNPDPVEVVDEEETQPLVISTAVNLAQALYKDESELESLESENKTEVSNISTAVDLNEEFDENASGSPNPNLVEVVDEEETQQFVISTAVNLAQAFYKDESKLESLESKNQTEVSNISTAVDLNKEFDKDESESSESSKSESEKGEGDETE